MDITSTPFIRNDYWPDYNELNELNGRIDEVENELSLTNINLTDKIENVEGNLNAYISQQNNTVVTNNVVVNNINANYATGDFLNFNNVNLDNVYVENLTVNKPVFDITLNTPHIDNITVTGGNIFNTNIVNCEINTDNITVNNLNVADGFAEKLVTNELIINKSIAPVSSSAVLGYDATGKVIPVRATYDVSFPEDANYLYTDHFGTAYAGTAETEVTASDNLITANAVYNEALNITGNVDNLRNDMNNEFNIVNDNFVNIDNNFNDVANNFNDVANDFNNVNNTANNLLDNVDYLKSALAPLLNLAPANVSGWVNSTSPVNIQGITSFVVAPFAAPVMTGFDVGDGAKLNVNGTTATLGLPGIQWTKGSMNKAFQGCTLFNQNILIPNGVTQMVSTFQGCTNFNQNIQIPNNVTSIAKAFFNCNYFDPNIVPSDYTGNAYDYINLAMANTVNHTFNQNIAIPDGVVNMSSTFYKTGLNQNILIPNSVSDLSKVFSSGAVATSIPLKYENGSFVKIDEEILTYDAMCSQFNQNIAIPDDVVNMSETFGRAACLNQNILIPNSVSDLSYTFAFCISLNQNILIPNSATNINNMFASGYTGSVTKFIKDNVVSDWDGSMAFNQPNMCIFSQNITDMSHAFTGCHINNIHIPTSVPKDTSNFMYNCLVNGNTGITFPAANIFNDLPVDIEQWPPEA